MIRFNNTCCSTTSSMSNLGDNNNNFTPTKKKYRKKPDPTAPKITRPCSECGKKFWSWKALFGHMRCHPERQWRGINPPSNFNKNHHHKENLLSSVAVASTSGSSYSLEKMTEDDHDAALSLLMLVNGFGSKTCSDQSPSITTLENVGSPKEGVVVMSGSVGGGDGEVVWGSDGGNSCRFECSSCKKVFGSHQALGGHRASHKNVKGCFANTRNNDEVVLEDELSSGNLQNSYGGIVVVEDENDKMLMTMGLSLGLNSGIQVQQHECNICFRVFSSGQTLGGHKRCHWEKFDDNGNNNVCSEIDLNFPATALPPRVLEGDNTSYCHHSWSLEALDLRLGL